MRRRELTRHAAEAAALVSSGKVAAPKRRASKQPNLTPAMGVKAPMPRTIEPSKPTLVEKSPSGPDWLHEIKFDGYRLIGFVAGGNARLDTRGGLDWTDRFPCIGEALARLPVETAVVDGEAVVEVDGLPDFGALQAALGGRAGKRASPAVPFTMKVVISVSLLGSLRRPGSSRRFDSKLLA